MMRGKHITKPIENGHSQAEELAADGVRELILVAQDMTSYGLDLYGRPRLAELLKEIDKDEGRSTGYASFTVIPSSSPMNFTTS